MNSNSTVATPLRGLIRRTMILSALLSALCAADLRAQVGNNNPTGPSGIFNGQSGSCGYDPYTGNATRTITDIAVAGAVGEYPLALVRTANSRAPSTTEVFGFAGGWNHNYNWIMEDSPPRSGANLPPTQYTVDFPDGRVETFKYVTWDTAPPCTTTAHCYRVRLGGETTSAGVRERLVPIAPPGVMYAYLLLPDGGKLKFQATQYNSNGQYFYKYTAIAIIDPHGLQTALTWQSYGNNGQKTRLQKVTEPAGRYLWFSYTGPNSSKISQVQEFINGVGRRNVQYQYPAGYLWLGSVVYYGNPTWTARYQYIGSNTDPNLPPLLWTADDPMYPGPMRRIAYDYKPATPNNPDGSTPVYGQILRERYWDGVAGHETSGAAVSTLAVGTDGVHTGSAYRKETRGDGAIRGFIYNGAGQVTWASDFMGHQSTMGYDDKKYLNSYINFNRVTADYTNDPITGNVTQIRFPLTPEDTNGQGNTRPTVNYTYTNNYYLHTTEDEGHNITTITRNGNNRVTRIDYSDGGWETFSYDPSHFYQLQSHRMVTGGTENWTYDSRHRKDTYRNPDSPSPSPSPSAKYYYDTLDRVSSVHDALNHATDYQYNDRGQLTLTTLPWFNGPRYTISNVYNNDGTLQRTTDQLNHSTSYTYDDYRRLKSVTPPARGDGTGTHTTYFYYGANPWDGVNDYKLTDSNVTYVVPPSSSFRKIKAVYDDNRRKTSAIVAPGTAEEAATSYTYDGAGNVTWVTNPLGHNNVHTLYDARNRPYFITVGGQTTTLTYDTAGRKKSITRANGQVVTNVSFDEMNRVTQVNATQTPTGTAITKYTYYAGSGLLHTMQDPRLVATQSSEQYEYRYDQMGRKTWLFYPANGHAENFIYDQVGRLSQFKNRAGRYQTFSYDALNRMTRSEWDDGLTPRVDYGYDAASRLTAINNANATISRLYWDDNSLKSETETPTGGVARTVTYYYDTDGNRERFYMPGYSFQYEYTWRNQLKNIVDYSSGGQLAHYDYDERGNVTTRTVYTSPPTQSTYSYDSRDRATWVTHALNGTSRGFNYGYQDNTDNRKYVRRTGGPLGGLGDVFNYGLADQVTGVQLDVQSPQTTPTPTPNITYDTNGNRTTFRPYGPTDNYTLNDLNQYVTRNNTSAGYDLKGNMTTGFDGSTYQCDAQNRLTQAIKSGVTMSFAYDGLNRQVSRTVNGTTTYSVWDGWDLVEEYTNSPRLTIQARYLYGPTGLVKNLTANRYYYQDASGSTSHLTDANGNLLEWYRYDLQGTPIVYDTNNNQLSTSNYSVRHLFTGQQWYQDVGLYDLRTRFYSPDLGRFLQPDPIGFDGDATNLYRYVGNNPVTNSDPTGEYAVYKAAGNYWYYIVNPGYESFITRYVPGSKQWCAAGCQILAGGNLFGSAYYQMPSARDYWIQGAPLSSQTPIGAVVAIGWQNGRYPSLSTEDYKATYPGSPINHAGIFLGFDERGNAVILDQYIGKPLDRSPSSPNGWYEVNVAKDNGPYAPGSSTDPNGRGGVVVSGPPLSKNEQAKIRGLLWLVSRYNRYWGYLPTTNTTNWAGGIAGPNILSPWEIDSTNSPTLSNFGNITIGMGIGAMEFGDSCFVAGTPVLMADGSEKAIESIQVGEAVLAWNEQTKKIFTTKVVKTLHHDEKMQTLFDIELEDGRKFTVNNTHPMYVVEDGDFTFTDELAARFAKGQPITFQDSTNQPVKIASLRMRSLVCKTYNLHVEGQGEKGHAYYANGILVHNTGVNRSK